MRMVNTGVVWGGHDGFIGSSCSIKGSEWGSSSGNRSRCRGVLFPRGLSGSRGNVGEWGIWVFPT